MSSTRGVRWLMWVVVTPPMSAATAETPLELGVPGPVDRLRRTARTTRPPARGTGPRRPAESPPCSTARSARSSSSSGNSSRAPRNVRSRRSRSASKNRRSSGHQHRGEHPERVRRQLLAVQRAERRRHRPGSAPARRPAGRRTRTGDMPSAPKTRATWASSRGRADPDRAVPLGGHPVDAAQPLGVRALARDSTRWFTSWETSTSVGVGRHLGAVQPRTAAAAKRAAARCCSRRGRWPLLIRCTAAVRR